MKFKKRIATTLTTAVSLLTLAIPLAAQHQRYRVVEIGTFGGSASSTDEVDMHVLNNRGTLVGRAETPVVDPAPDFSEGGLVTHTFQWRKGVLTDLGTLPGYRSSEAHWLSANGLIAGVAEKDTVDPLIPDFPPFQAVLWKNGRITGLGTLDGGHQSFATSVNSRGQIAGWAFNSVPDINSMTGGVGFETRAFIWQNGNMQDLGTLGGSDALAIAINERGQVIGQSYTGSTPSDYCASAIEIPLATGAFMWQKGAMRDLGNFGGTCTIPQAINNQGQVVGLSTLAGDSAQHAFLYDHGVLRDLGTFGGDTSSATELNEAGDVVGFASYPGNGVFHATLWSKGALVDLGALDQYPISAAWAINERGQIVGVSIDAEFNNFRPFLTQRGGTMVDLNAFLAPDSNAVLETPASINDRGEIAVLGRLTTGEPRVFMVIPCNSGEAKGCRHAKQELASIKRAPNSGKSLKVKRDKLRLLRPGGFSRLRRDRKRTSPTSTTSSNASATATEVALASVPVVSLSPTSLTLATQALGTTSPAKTVTLKNSGTAALAITGIALIGTNPGSFSQTHTCGSSLAVGSTCTIAVRFQPGATGLRTAALSVSDNAAGSPQKVALSGIGTTAKLTPTSLNFGTVAIGTTTSVKTVSLTNIGTKTITITSIAITGTNYGSFSQTHNCASSLPPGGFCTLTIKFKPTASGLRTASISVADDAAGSPQKVSLNGIGTTAKLSPTNLDFGSVRLGYPISKTLTLTNIGTTNLTIGSITLTGSNPGDFAETHTCGSSLIPTGFCSINITFKPVATSLRTAVLSISDSAAGSPQKVSLSGSGVANRCVGLSFQCSVLTPCCPGLVCRPTGNRAFCASSAASNSGASGANPLGSALNFDWNPDWETALLQ